MISFMVQGIPAPKGSARAFMPRKGGRFPVVTHDNPRTKPWERAVTLAAIRASVGHETMRECGVVVTLRFYLPPPKVAKRAQPCTRPDLDKLVRCVLDGLTKSGIFHDDGQVTWLRARKEWATTERAAGVYVDVGEDL